jgi:predicted RNase H-like HicB family nuclease
MTDAYPIVIFWSDEDDSWVADVPDLKYCSAFGGTPEEALKEVQVAKDLWLEVAREHGDPVPPPTRRRPAAHVAG